MFGELFWVETGTRGDGEMGGTRLAAHTATFRKHSRWKPEVAVAGCLRERAALAPEVGRSQLSEGRLACRVRCLPQLSRFVSLRTREVYSLTHHQESAPGT